MVDSAIARMICGSVLVEHDRDSQTKVGAKSVDEHGAPHICCLEDKDIDGLVG